MNYGGLICFLALLPRSFVLVRCLREANVAIFAGGLVGVDKHLFQRVSFITSMTICVLLLANVDVIPKQKQLSTTITIILLFNFELNISYVFLFVRNFKISFPSVFRPFFLVLF